MQNKNTQFPISFGRYIITRKIATGGMAEVFEAKIISTQSFEKKVVIKKLIDTYEKDKKFISLFIDEARITAKLNHFNIPQVYDFGMCENSYFIAMEYVDGADVCNFNRDYASKNGLLPLPWVLYILSSMAKALHYTHTFKVDKKQKQHIELVHRDVSPQNILINTQGVVKLIDFGVAKSNINLHKTEPGTIRGKYIYMSPEQINQQAVDSRSDIYSLGIMAYELLTGHNPFYEKSSSLKNLLLDVSKAKKRSILEIKPDLNIKVAQLIERMTARNPMKRFQSLVPAIKVISEIAAELNINFDEVQEELAQNVVKFSETKDTAAAANKIFTHNENDVAGTFNDSNILVLNKVTNIKTKPAFNPDVGEKTESDTFFQRVKKVKRLRFTFIGLSLLLFSLLSYLGISGLGTDFVSKKATAHQVEVVKDKVASKKTTLASTPAQKVKKKPSNQQPKPQKKMATIVKASSKHCPDDMKKISHQNQSYCVDKYEYPNIIGKVPVRAKQWQEARNICKSIGKDLCSSDQWLRACKNNEKNTSYPYGNMAKKAICNVSFSSKIKQDPMPSGAFNDCKSFSEIFDLSGNLSEWVMDQSNQTSQAVYGGSSWHTISDAACNSSIQMLKTAQEPNVGFRCCKNI